MRGAYSVLVVLIVALAAYFIGRQSQTILSQQPLQQPVQPQHRIQTELSNPSVESRANSPSTQVRWFTYDSRKPAYSIQYPRDFSLRKSGDEIVSIGGPSITLENDARTIVLEIDPLLGDPTPSFEDWAKNQAMLLCEADGPDARSYCDSITKISVFTTSGANSGYEIYMDLVNEDYSEGSTRKSTIGPVFIFDVSRIANQQREGLIIQLPSQRISPRDLDTIRSIVTTLTF